MGHRSPSSRTWARPAPVLSVLLFISLGLLSRLDGFTSLWPWALVIIGARFAGKALAVLGTAPVSGLGLRQALALMLALQPMSSLAVLLAADTFGWPSQLPGVEDAVLQALLLATTRDAARGPRADAVPRCARSRARASRPTGPSPLTFGENRSMSLAPFTVSEPLTLGVELELQIVSTHDFDLAPQAEDLLRVTARHSGAWDIKPEITRSMIEIGSSIQREHAPLLAELLDMRDQVAAGARRLNIDDRRWRHASFQHWSEQRIYPGRPLPLPVRAVRLPGQAVHRLRPARARRLRGRRQRPVAAACAVALRAALHRAVGRVAVRAGRRHRLRFRAAQLGVRLPAVAGARPSCTPGTSSAPSSTR